MPYLPSRVKRLTASLVVAMLALAPLGPGLMALSGDPVAMCSLHGRDCTCPDKCAQGHGAHEHQKAESEANLPACHRKPAAEQADSKPDCQMKGCGKEEQVAAAIQQPAEPARTVTDRLAPVMILADASFTAERAPLEAWLPPPSPPPRS